MELDLTEKKSAPVDDIHVDYTKRILESLKAKAKEHDVSLTKLKSVFIAGASNKDETNPLILLGFARVNMYLRLLDPAVAAHEFKEASNNKNFKKLMFDFSSHLTPKPEDYALAEEDLKKFNLNFNFDSIDELYLRDTQEISLYKDYL